MSEYRAKNESRREQAALLLAAGRNQREASAGAGVGTRTIRHWLAKDPAFGARVKVLCAGLIERAAARLGASTHRAARRLERLVHSENERVALSAARAVLGLARLFKETVEFEDRMTAVEHQMDGKGQSVNGEGNHSGFAPDSFFKHSVNGVKH